MRNAQSPRVHECSLMKAKTGQWYEKSKRHSETTACSLYRVIQILLPDSDLYCTYNLKNLFTNPHTLVHSR